MTSEATTEGKRAYRSPRRAEQAAQTRAAVIEAAIRLFAERGWAGTGMRDVAKEAGVAVETIYSIFRSKPELFMAALDVSVVGDDAPVAMADRDEFAVLAQGDFHERAGAAARLVTQVHLRTAGLYVALRQGAAAEPELALRLQRAHDARRLNTQQGAELVAKGPVDAALVDALWALMSVEVFRLLTDLRGWSVADYETWITTEVVRHLRPADQ
jgi:AcrR family transcriptional regulator